MLLGLIITVQGFETSRYLGHDYPPEMRIRTMRHAQWIASGIYLAFIALLTPFLSRAAATEGVAGILDIMELIAPAMGIFVLIGAVSSQLSAAVADSIGSGGLVNEVSRRKISVPIAFTLAGRTGDPRRLADRSVPGRRAILARVRVVLRDAVRAGVARVDQIGGRDHPTADWFRRDRSHLPRRRVRRRAGGGLSHGENDPARTHVLVKRHGPTAPVWRRRVAILGGAIAIGVVSLAFTASRRPPRAVP